MVLRQLFKWVSTDMKITVGSVIFILLVASAVLAPVIAPHDPNIQRLKEAYKPPAWMEGGDWRYPLGTDSLGRDVLSRVLYGARVALYVAVLATVISAAIGTVLGLIAGYYKRFVDEVIMRFVDMWMSFPPVLLAIALIAILGVGINNVVIAIAVVDWTRFARVIRGETLNIREREFVEAAKAAGLTSLSIIRREIIPNIMPLLMVLATIEMSIAISVEVLLSYVGLGVKANTPSWGSMLSEGLAYFRTGWWSTIFPMIALITVILGLNMLGEGIREKIDPRLQISR